MFFQIYQRYTEQMESAMNHFRIARTYGPIIQFELPELHRCPTITNDLLKQYIDHCTYDNARNGAEPSRDQPVEPCLPLWQVQVARASGHSQHLKEVLQVQRNEFKQMDRPLDHFELLPQARLTSSHSPNLPSQAITVPWRYSWYSNANDI